MNSSFLQRRLSILVKKMIQLKGRAGSISYRKRVKISRTPIVITHALSILNFNKVLIKKLKRNIFKFSQGAFGPLTLFYF